MPLTEHSKKPKRMVAKHKYWRKTFSCRSFLKIQRNSEDSLSIRFLAKNPGPALSSTPNTPRLHHAGTPNRFLRAWTSVSELAHWTRSASTPMKQSLPLSAHVLDSIEDHRILAKLGLEMSILWYCRSLANPQLQFPWTRSPLPA